MTLIQPLRIDLEQQNNQHLDRVPQKHLDAQTSQLHELTSMKMFADDIVHELNNMLTPILVIAELVQLKFPNADPRTQQLLSLLTGSAKRTAAYVRQIPVIARGYKN